MLRAAVLVLIPLFAPVLGFAQADGVPAKAPEAATTELPCTCPAGTYAARIKLVVTADGLPTKVAVVMSSGNACGDAKAVDAVKKYKFAAKGKALDMVIDINFDCDKSSLK